MYNRPKPEPTESSPPITKDKLLPTPQNWIICHKDGERRLIMVATEANFRILPCGQLLVFNFEGWPLSAFAAGVWEYVIPASTHGGDANG